MENCTIQEITYIDELIELCEKASKSNHPNAINYDEDATEDDGTCEY